MEKNRVITMPGDLIIISGTIADYGLAIMTSREGFSFRSSIISDTAALNGLTATMIKAGSGSIHTMRDPTRGGVAASLNEWAKSSGVGIRIQEEVIPVKKEVAGACEILGFDPLYVANEGKLLAAVSPEGAEAVLKAMKQHPLGKDSVIIGKAESDNYGRVIMNTALGTTRIIDMPIAEQLPRIC
jgi:hydrogenase expression/formation protein HypE